MEVEELTRFELQVLVEQIRSLNHSIAELEKVIDREGKKLKGHGNLTSIKGIGSLGASILLSVIGDLRDFSDEAGWRLISGSCPACTTPMRRSTPGTSPNGAASWAARRWCNAHSSPNATVPTWQTTTSASAAGAEPVAPSSPWPGNFLELSIAR